MLKIVVAIVIAIHGLIHLMGFAKAFQFGNVTALAKDIAKPLGIAWLAASLLLIVISILLMMKKDLWWMAGFVAVVLSQVLVIMAWHDAKFGTIVNSVLLLLCVLSYGNWRFERKYQNDVAVAVHKVTNVKTKQLTEAEIIHLPLPVQKYLHYVGVVNKPIPKDYRIAFTGEMREKGKNWFPFRSEQFNFTGKPTRLFFMKATLFGITVPGYHAYKCGSASMQIKLFGLFPMVNAEGGILDQAETVTIFNDMCLFAPATLVDKRITWAQVDSSTVKATFTVNEHVIGAFLCFNAKGQLVNFISDDRYEIGARQRYRFSTPVSHYKNFNGYNLPAYGEAIWHYPDGDFVYGKFHLKGIAYNLQEERQQ